MASRTLLRGKMQHATDPISCKVQLKGSGVQLHIAYPGMTQTAMLDSMDARTRGLIDELPGVIVYPTEQV